MNLGHYRSGWGRLTRKERDLRLQQAWLEVLRFAAPNRDRYQVTPEHRVVREEDDYVYLEVQCEEIRSKDRG